ncbi:MAG: MBL fold metallo-hydrolase [Clostridia bacterium]|nr:MBL fold metallo-hydrolase [Clostridia bacterium]
MKFQYLGTAAAEGMPAVFCNCEVCATARERGGKNFRTRSQSIINDELLMDFPPDSMMHFHMHGIRGDKIKYIVFTHSHSDHYYATDLLRHGGCYAHNMAEETLGIVCSEQLWERMQKDLAGAKKDVILEYHVAKPFESMTLGEYELIPFPARHSGDSEGKLALFYALKYQGKTILYAHDTGFFFEEVFDYIKEKGLYFDMVSLDCTNAHLLSKPTGSHMGLNHNAEVLEKLREMGAVDEKTVCYVNHFSHNGNPLHDELSESAAKIGFNVSYDGLTLEI